MIPLGNHTDWIWPLSYIPRSWTAIPTTVLPVKIWGSSPAIDIPQPGTWILQRSRYGLNFALTTKKRWHFRIGSFRYDYVDQYVELFTFTIKKLK